MRLIDYKFYLLRILRNNRTSALFYIYTRSFSSLDQSNYLITEFLPRANGVLQRKIREGLRKMFLPENTS